MDAVTLAAATAAGRKQFAPRRELRPVAVGTHVLSRSGGTSLALSDGVSTGITTQMQHTCTTAFTGLRLVFCNWYNAGQEADTPNDIVVKALVRYQGVLLYVTFNGSRSVTIAPGATVVSDPLGFTQAKGATFYTRTFVSVTSGGSYPLGATSDAYRNEWVAAGDLLSTGTAPANTATKSYGPWALLGTPTKALASPRLLIVGDSRAVGYNDVLPVGTTTQDAFGWVRRAFDGKLSYVNLSLSGTSAGNMIDWQGGFRRFGLADACGTYEAAIVSWGINDITGGASAATVQTRLQAVWALLTARGLPVYGATIPPVTTSTDNWATTANQTLAPANAVRLAVNAWLRTKPAPLVKVYEFADAVESARDSGLWKANGTAYGYTQDGVHESTGGYTAEAALIDPATFGPILT